MADTQHRATMETAFAELPPEVAAAFGDTEKAKFGALIAAKVKDDGISEDLPGPESKAMVLAVRTARCGAAKQS